MFGVHAAKNPFQVRLHKGPRALVLWLFLTPDHFGLREPLEFFKRRDGWERVILFDPHQVDIVYTAGIARFEQIIINLARAHHHTFDFLICDELCGRVACLCIIPQHAVEGRAIGEIIDTRDCHFVPQQRFGRHQNERLAEIAVHLAAQDMEVIRRCGTIGDDPVVLSAHLQEPFKPGRAMFRPLAFVAMRQEHNQPRHAQPFAFARADELIKHDLRPIGKIAKLGLPKGQRIGLGQRIAIFKSQHGIFRQH